MKQVEDFGVSRLRVEEDFSFLMRVKSLAASCLTLETDKAMVEAFGSAVDAFDAALKASVKNSQTEAMNAADALADRRWSAANAYVKAMAEHPDADIAAKGGAVVVIFRKFGVLTTMGFDEEYGRYHNLLQELAALPEETLTALSLSPWLTSMQDAVAGFLAARESKVQEDSIRQVGIVKESRTAADNAYRALAQRVNALVIVNGEDAYASFIDQLNVIIADAQAMLAGRSTKSAKAKEERTKA